MKYSTMKKLIFQKHAPTKCLVMRIGFPCNDLNMTYWHRIATKAMVDEFNDWIRLKFLDWKPINATNSVELCFKKPAILLDN